MKKWIIVAICLIIGGCALFGGAMMALNFDWLKLDTHKQETNIYEITENFENISIDALTSDIDFVLSDNQECKIKCVENEKEKHSVTVQNGTLRIQAIDTRKWFEHIGFLNFKKNVVTVYLPRNTYSSLSVNDNTGNVNLPKNLVLDKVSLSGNTGNMTCESAVSDDLKINTSTGKITVQFPQHTLCKSFSAESATGSVICNGVVAENTIRIQTSTGNINFNNGDAPSIFIQSSTGNINGSVLSEKIFVANSSTGHVKVPKTDKGNRCELTTSTGNIDMSILKTN